MIIWHHRTSTILTRARVFLFPYSFTKRAGAPHGGPPRTEPAHGSSSGSTQEGGATGGGETSGGASGGGSSSGGEGQRERDGGRGQPNPNGDQNPPVFGNVNFNPAPKPDTPENTPPPSPKSN